MKTRISLITVVLAMAIAAVPVRADVITDWNLIAVQSVVAAGATRPGPVGTLDMAMVHLAMYDAVQAIEKEYDPYYVDIPNASGSVIGAAAKAAHDVLIVRFPSQAPALGVTLTNYLAANAVAANDPGITVGQKAAAGIIALRACDGAFPNPAPPPFTGGTAPGQWRPTGTAQLAMNPGPWYGQITPFLLQRTFQFRSETPPSLNSRRYARDYNEVKAFGSLNNSSRSAAQTDMAYFWTGNFVAMLNAVVRAAALERVPKTSHASRLFALTTAVAADTGIAVWNDKAHFQLWRPETAIHNGHLDDNSQTVQDPNWQSLVAAPPYPDYTSGANGLTSATMNSLIHYFDDDRMNFSITTTATGPTINDTRQYTSFEQVMDEVVDARVYLGIHFRFADTAARTLGKRVAKYGHNNYFRPVGGPGDAPLIASAGGQGASASSRR